MRNDTSSFKIERSAKGTNILMEKKEIADSYTLIIHDSHSTDLGNDHCMPVSMSHTLHMLFHLTLTINVQGKCGVMFWSFIVKGARLNLTMN